MEPVPSDAVIVSRLGPRAQAAHLIVREGLLKRLAMAPEYRLIIIEAPAGYGKTSLLVQWREHLLQDRSLVGWLTLDPDDRDAGDLLLYILHALIRGGLHYEGPAFDKAMGDEATVRRHVRLLLNAVAAEPRPVFLMFDEFEHISAEALETVIRRLLRLMPDNLRVVFAARKIPDLKLAAMKAQGLVSVLSTDELRFARSEIDTLFSGALSPADLEAVENQTAGWPVMLQLLKGARQEAVNPSELLRGMELSETASDYLSEQVLSELQPRVREALIRTAPLEVISPGAFEAVLGTDESWDATIQEPILRPFLVPADNDLPACKVHPVVQAFLWERFQKLPQDEQRVTLAKAAAWYASANRYAKAVRLALLTQDEDLAGKIVEDAGGVQIWIRKGFSLIQQLDEMLTEALLERFPRLQLMRTLVYIKVGKVMEARALYEVARARTGNFSYDREGGSATALRLDSVIVEATLLVNECRAPDDEYLNRHEDTISSIAGGDDVFLGNAKIVLCLVYHQKGRFSEARRYAEECATHYRRADVAHGEFFAYLHKGLICFATGHHREALANYQEARTLWHRHFDEDRRKLALLTPLTMEVHFETGTDQPALKKLRESNRELNRSEGWFDIFASEYTVTAMTALAVEGLESALNELALAQEEVSKRQLESVERLIQATRISCLALGGEVDMAQQALSRAGFSLEAYALAASNHVPWREREAVLTAVARVLLHSDEPHKAIAMLVPLISPLQSNGTERTAVRFGILLALSHWRAGEMAAFVSALEGVLLRIKRHGYVRGFFEEGALAFDALTDYLGTVGRASAATIATGTAREILTRLTAYRDKDRTGLLTPRELAVVGALAQGHADKVIARELGMSHNTVRYHLKNVFNKLGTASRLDTVVRARALKLID